MYTNILPINLFQYEIPKISPIFNPNYVNNLITNGVLQDLFIPGVATQNPIFAQVNDLNEKIGILQTATNGIDKILNYIDVLKQTNPDEKEVINDLVNDINSIIKNTTYNSTPVFGQTLSIGDNKVNLSLPLLDLNKTTIEDYEKLLTQKQKNLFNVLENVSIQLPTQVKFNPNDIETFETLLNSGELTQAYNTELINPLTLQLLMLS